MAQAIAQYGSDRQAIFSATGRCAANLKRYEEQGVDTEMVKATWKELQFTQNEAEARHLMRTKYLIAGGAITLADEGWTATVEQAGMDLAPPGGAAADAVVEVRARIQGYKAGLKGHVLSSNPYAAQPGSIAYVAWDEGCRNGQEERIARRPDAAHTTMAPDTRTRPEPPAAETAEDIAAGVAAELSQADQASAHP